MQGAFYGHLIFLSWYVKFVQLENIFIFADFERLLLLLTYRALITNWSPSAYFFYNILFLILLLWGIAAKGNVEPLEMVNIKCLTHLTENYFNCTIHLYTEKFCHCKDFIFSLRYIKVRESTSAV